MRYIGLDLGTKTLGVAVSDKTETIASAITTLRFSENNPEEILDDLTKIMDEYKVGAIVIGLPKNMNNSLGFAAERTKEFVKVLNNTYDIPVYEQDEDYHLLRLTMFCCKLIFQEKKESPKWIR